MKDELSALLDGDLDEASARPVFDAMKRDPVLQSRWNAYCLIGDALRGETGSPGDLSARVMERIREEPTVLAPVRGDSAANATGAWGKVMPLAASVMGVAAVGLVAFSLYSPSEPVAQNVVIAQPAQAVELASVRAQAPVASLERDDAHRKFVFVHQSMSGGGPIPGAVQYVRTVSESRGDLRR